MFEIPESPVIITRIALESDAGSWRLQAKPSVIFSSEDDFTMHDSKCAQLLNQVLQAGVDLQLILQNFTCEQYSELKVAFISVCF